MNDFRLQIFIGLALGCEASYLAIASLTNVQHHVPLFLLLYALAFLCYLAACFYFFDFQTKQSETHNKEQHPTEKLPWFRKFIRKQVETRLLSPKAILTIGILFGCLFRLTLLFGPPSLSEDIYRYVWDGRVAAQGINPYLYPPAAQELSNLRDAQVYPNINHRGIPTIYPPAAQLLFLGLTPLHSSLITFKTAFMTLDLLTIVLLFLILKSLAMNLKRLLIYVWNPLLIVEISGSGHLDIVGIFLLCLALLLLIKRRLLWANFVLTLSVLTKFFTLMFLPVLTLVKKENKLIFVLLFVIVVSVFYLPYADAGTKLFTGLLTYADKWQFNSSLFSVVRAGVQTVLPRSLVINLMITPYGMTPDATTIASRTTDLNLLISKGIIITIFTAMLVFFLLRLNKDLQKHGEVWFFKIGLIFLGTFLLLTPTVHPWYVCWIVPFLAIVPTAPGFCSPDLWCCRIGF